jgi:hypothetical protein
VSTTPPSGSGNGPRPKSGFEEVIDRIEAEMRHAVGYVNDSVVPQVRRESITAIRRLSDTLRNLADRFEASGNRQNPPSGAGQNPSQNPSEQYPSDRYPSDPANKDPRA